MISQAKGYIVKLSLWVSLLMTGTDVLSWIIWQYIESHNSIKAVLT